MIFNFNFLCLILIFLVPAHLLGFKEIIKISDILILLMGIVILINFFFSGKIKLPRPRVLWLLPSFYFILSCFYVLNDFQIPSIFFGMRFIELLILYLSIIKLNLKQTDIILNFIIFATLFWVSVAYFIPEINFIRSWGPRAVGHFVGPFEIASIFTLYFIYFNKISTKLISLGFVFISNTKAAFLSFFILFCKKIITKYFLFYLTILLLLAYLFLQRFDYLNNLKIIVDTYHFIPSINNYVDYKDFFENRWDYFDQNVLDASTALRFITYYSVFNSYNFTSIILGNGPGFYGTAVDSSFLRFFGECGIFFFVYLLLYINELLKPYKNKLSKFAILIFFLFFDILYSINVMICLFLIYHHHNLYINEKK